MDIEDFTEVKHKEIEDIGELVKKGHYAFYELVFKKSENDKTDFKGLKLVKEDWLAKHADNTVTWESFDKFLTRLSKQMYEITVIVTGTAVNMINERLQEVQKHAAARIIRLERQLAEATRKIEALEKAEERTLADSFRGTWQPGNYYTRGGLVVWGGGLWLAMSDTGEKPGSSDSWRQVTKPGKDAVPK